MNRGPTRRLERSLVFVPLLVIMLAQGGMDQTFADAGRTLLPTNLPEREWVTFETEGFSQPVCGSIFRAHHPATQGMPLGGIDTGYLDLDTGGTFGYMSIFGSFVPPRGPLNVPFLGMSTGGRTWVLSAYGMPGVTPAKDIHYWGHYPVADLEFELDAPVSVGMRAWSPFIPGDTKASMLPGAVFEVHLRNTTAQPQKGTLAFDFPGFDRLETALAPLDRKPVQSSTLNGVHVRGESGWTAEYFLGVMGDRPVRIGRSLGWDASAWQNIAATLPPYEPREHVHSATCVATDFSLAPNERQIIRFLLTWNVPIWLSRGTFWGGGDTYTHMYARLYPSVIDAANILARKHTSLLRRILAWQDAIYSDASLPGWLQDSLINMLHLITKTSLWAQAKPPIGPWCREEDGAFAMNECPRSCPGMETVACHWYGDFPLVYFFPDAELSMLRGFKAAYLDPNVPLGSGGPCSMFGPRKLGQSGQYTFDGSSLVDMIDRIWQRTGNEEVLREFYDFAKQATVVSVTLRPDYGVKQVISMPTGNAGDHWFQSAAFFGMVPHVGGIRLASLRIMRRMAEAMGDSEFIGQCDEWLAGGSQALEDELWNGDNYLVCYEPETGRKSDLGYVFGYQLEGEWVARFHGLPGVFQPDRVQKTLDTIAGVNADEQKYPRGAVLFGYQEGRGKGPDAPNAFRVSRQSGFWTVEGSHPPANMILAMTYMYAGDRDFGMDLLRRTMDNLTNRQGVVWDQPNVYRADTGAMIFGNDYFQNMMLWAVPAAIEGQDLAGPCQPGGLVDRVLKAAKGE